MKPSITSLAPFALGALLTALATGPALAGAPREEAHDEEDADRGPAGLPHPGLYVGISGGYNAVLGDWDLNGDPDAGIAPEGSPIFGLHLGLQATHWLALEGGFALIPFSAEGPDDLSGMALAVRGDVLVSPIHGNWSPHLLVGGGFYQLASGDLGDDADWDLHWGLGLRGMLTRSLALRVEARHNLTDSFGDGLASLVEVQVGVDLWLWDGTHVPPPADTDGDGFIDAQDACPSAVGVASAQGCPDRDADGVPDPIDGCPDILGPMNQRGCLDTDADGVFDDVDRCKDVVGDEAHQGCAPPPPDKDADGVLDQADQCPEVPGLARAKGCPDHDGDGMIDSDDTCPRQPGVPEEGGCLPPALRERFSGPVRGIAFTGNTATIRPGSFALLDEAVALFKLYPSLRLEISGHTDDQGDDAANLELSKARAEAVKAYLVGKGIAAARILTVGHGEAKPVAGNDTERGRTQNRRIEFAILGQF